MAISTKLMRMQLNLLKPLANNCSIELSRATQDRIGALMGTKRRSKIRFSNKVFKNFMGRWIIPKKCRSSGMILFLHGGGYVCGELDYVNGFGSSLAAENERKVFAPAYRLAPESPYPAALEDVLESYEYLLSCGYGAEDIFLCGESAGGGLVYALLLKLKEKGLPMPRGVIALSPWVDLTFSGKSFLTNKDRDPSLTKERLEYYASLYGGDALDPFVSPVFGNLEGLPPSIVFVGGAEILLDDSVLLHNTLLEKGNQSRLVVTKDMWHVYTLYDGLKESQKDMNKIRDFIKKIEG